MGGVSSKNADIAITSKTPEGKIEGPDYSIMLLCNKDMKKFEYMLFLAAESCRLSYCDVGILQQSMKAYGMSPDILNEVITHYDAKACPAISIGKCKKRNVLSRVSAKFAPPESYELNACADGFEHSGKPILIRYISSPTDTTCIVVNPSVIQPNSNSIIQSSDCIVTFKGSSSIRNWDKNLSASAPGDFASVVKDILPNAPPGIMVSTSYITPISEIFDQIVEAIEKVCPGCTRIFVFGHSKGGAECELASIMFALKFPDKEIHTISLGAPKVFSPSSVEKFDDMFFIQKQGKFTLTRIESITPSGKDDLVTLLPTTMVHPGWGSKTQTLDLLRSEYGIPSDLSNTRNVASWPFQEAIDLWKPSKKVERDALVQNVIKEKVVVPPPEKEEPLGIPEETPAVGGSTFFKVTTLQPTVSSHMNYFGMGFWGTQRLAGMGNPAKTALIGRNQENSDPNVNKTFVANIFQDCTKYQYVPWVGKGSYLSGVTDMSRSAVHGIQDVAQKVIKRGGRRRTPRKRKINKTKRSLK
jgi:Lipase (class 3)